MTMPSERTRALISAAEFLQELRFGTDTPDTIRAQAISVLRHFPAARSIEQEAKRQLQRQKEIGKSSWLLPVDELSREIERAVQFDDGLAAKTHLAAGRAIYYGDPRFPGQIVKEYPDGRRQLVDIDEKSVVTIIREI